jgi:glycosyltransferase involved in cell wall biosynthesis
VTGTKRRILVAGSTQGVYGGIEVFMVALARYLNSLAGYECKLAFKLVKGYQPEASFETLLEQSDGKAELLQRASPHLLKLIQWADLVHVQNFPPDVVFPALAMGKGLVSTQHNWRRSGLHPRQILWNLAHLCIPCITYNSRFVAQSWEGKGTLRSEHRVVIPTVSLLPDAAPITAAQRKGFCFIARWIPGKGADTLIRAYRSARLDPVQWPLRMMGTGPMLPQWEKLLQENPVPGIQLLGRVAEAVKWEVIRSSRWMVVPPSCLEDMGLTPIEGRALGVPSIASSVGGVPESAGDQALFFDADDEAGLSACLKQAADMEESDYARRSHRCRESLDDYLQPMTAYLRRYRKLT